MLNARNKMLKGKKKVLNAKNKVYGGENIKYPPLSPLKVEGMTKYGLKR